LLGSGIFLCIGLLVSNYAGSYEAAAPITSSIGMPFAFLGNLFLPVVFLPNILQTVSKFLPVTYLSDGLRQAYLYAFDLEKIGKDILILSLWLLGILLITLKVFKLKE
jgi:ABC-2 type transport system permease protein